MPKKEYPYQNLLLKTLKGEQWKDIPGLEEYFMISNLGRIKRLEYELPFKDGRVYIKKSQIIKPTLAKNINSYTHDDILFLRTTFYLFGYVYNFSIARMVYYCFVKKFDFKDKHIVVTFRDGDNRNIRPSNLQLISQHDVRLRIINQNRCENILLRPEIRAKAASAFIEKRGKRISQYNKKGIRLQTFQSIAEAAVATGIGQTNISGVLRGRKVTGGGFIWRYGQALKIDVEKFLQQRSLKYKKGLRKSVTQYDMRGNKIATYISLEEASRQTGVGSARIGKVINKKARSAGGFFWIGGAGLNKINLYGYHYGIGSGSLKKRVKQYSKKEKLVRIYPSITMASKAVGVSKGVIVGALKGTYKTAGGFLWRYA